MGCVKSKEAKAPSVPLNTSDSNKNTRYHTNNNANTNTPSSPITTPLNQPPAQANLPVAPTANGQNTSSDAVLPPPLPHYKTLEEGYTVLEKLGQGGFATVHKGQCKFTKKYVAIKFQTHSNIPDRKKNLLDEINILKLVKHEHIVEFYDYYENAQKAQINIVMELLHGGELFDRIISMGNINEHAARDLVLGLLKALKFIHDKEIVHRDLKPENLLMINESSNLVKIADFGLATKLKNGLTTDFVGTVGYQAPEILYHDPYGKPVDMWAFGIILFIMLAGYVPFHDPCERRMNENIKRGDLDFPADYWSHVSPEAIDFIKCLLCLDPNKRLTAGQALQHKWCTASPELLEKHNLDAKKLLKFQAKRKLRAGIKAVIAVNRFNALAAAAFAAANSGKEDSSRTTEPA